MKIIALLITIASALTACGGGSSTPSGIVIPAKLQTTLVSPTYATSEELTAFNAINTFRYGIGLGYWLQNTLLDQAAKNHMAYSEANGSSFQQDSEVLGNPGFTGTTPSQRAIFTGYSVLANTVTARNIPTATVGELYAMGSGSSVVDSMINTIYHRSGLMTQSTVDIGLARGMATPGTHWWFSHGRLNEVQWVASDYVAVYPADLQTNVPRTMTPEHPSVYSNQANFDFATQTSSPVSFTSAASTNLTVASFTVTPADSNVPLAGTIWTINNDPNVIAANSSHIPISPANPPLPIPTLSSYEAYWVGKAPFLPKTKYNVTFTGSTYLVQYGRTQQVTKSWSFVTGDN